MALIQSMEKQGNFLFRYRGQFPILLFVLAIPFIYSADYNAISKQGQVYFGYCAITLSIIGFLIRFYTIGTTTKGTSGRNTSSQVATVLNSKGVYSVVRHPLYLGNYLIWLGIAVFTFNVYFIVIMSLLFWLYYERIMFAEEQFLESKFGDNFLNWSNVVPAFIPSFLKFTRSEISFSLISVLRREYASILSSIIGFVFVEGFRNYFRTKLWVISTFSFRLLIGALILVFILRSLKHYTNLLREEGRS